MLGMWHAYNERNRLVHDIKRHRVQDPAPQRIQALSHSPVILSTMLVRRADRGVDLTGHASLHAGPGAVVRELDDNRRSIGWRTANSGHEEELFIYPPCDPAPSRRILLCTLFQGRLEGNSSDVFVRLPPVGPSYATIKDLLGLA